LVAVDVGEGKVLAVGQVDENDPEAVRDWLEHLVKELGVEVVVSDDLSGYPVVTDRDGVRAPGMPVSR
jgi:hypothetical protein